jgi:hypothetical protein
MNESKQQKVNIKRLRLFKDFADITNVADQHETELDIAKREIAAISNEIQSLAARKQQIEAVHDIQYDENNNENSHTENTVNANVMAFNVGVGYVLELDNVIW